MEKPMGKTACVSSRDNTELSQNLMLLEFMCHEGIILCQEALHAMQLCSLPEQLDLSLFLFN